MKITQKQAKTLAVYFKVDLKKTPFREYWIGLNEEMEHKDVVKDNKHAVARIVNAHIKENPRYYYWLKRAGL